MEIYLGLGLVTSDDLIVAAIVYRFCKGWFFSLIRFSKLYFRSLPRFSCTLRINPGLNKKERVILEEVSLAAPGMLQISRDEPLPIDRVEASLKGLPEIFN